MRLTVSRRGNVVFFLGERRGSDVRGSRDGEDDCSGLGIWKRDCNWRDMFSLSCSDVLLSAGFLIYFVGCVMLLERRKWKMLRLKWRNKRWWRFLERVKEMVRNNRGKGTICF